ncbi:MAG: hypothetical protein R2880_13285 [Deinococcales bacterium]
MTAPHGHSSAYLLDDSSYYERYLGYLQEMLKVFEPNDMNQRYDKIIQILRSYAADDVSIEAFDADMLALKQRT